MCRRVNCLTFKLAGGLWAAIIPIYPKFLHADIIIYNNFYCVAFLSCLIIAIKCSVMWINLVFFFIQTNNQNLCLAIINSIQSLLSYDNANYFIIEALHPFSQFINKMPDKSGPVREAILKLVEFVAFQLSWVPSQELVAMTILFKDQRYFFLSYN